MGGHVDARDHHGAIFDAEALAEAMTAAGLLALRPWVSEQTDCAALPISLNLEGTKPPERWPHVRAVISVPRLGWNDMWGCAMDACGRLGIRLVKHTGAPVRRAQPAGRSDRRAAGAPIEANPVDDHGRRRWQQRHAGRARAVRARTGPGAHRALRLHPDPHRRLASGAARMRRASGARRVPTPTSLSGAPSRPPASGSMSPRACRWATWR